MRRFIGRQTELHHLSSLINKKTASFVVIKGRRRIGKSTLVKEFSKSFDHFYSFVGLPPDSKTTNQHQLDEFSRQMARQFHMPFASYKDWSDALWHVGDRVKSGKVLVLFDEISWMGSKDPTFLGKIKNLWDLQLKENNHLIFIVCGSASSWIEKNILSSTGFVGRVSFTLTLDELSLVDCAKFWPKNISAYEKLKCLVVTGGIPKYLEEIDPKLSAEDNIKRLCFIKGGFLVDEFEKIFSDIFLRKSAFYKKILQSLANGAKEQNEIHQFFGEKLGRIPEYLQELELAGFIKRDHTFKIKTGQESELSKYRLSDNYMRFYLKYIEKNLSKINRNAFVLKTLTSLPEWYSMMGLQFENLVLNNRALIHQHLGLSPSEIICDNPFFQRKTSKTVGCQIDYMIETKFDTLYVCEIKFSKHPIGMEVVSEVAEKINRLQRPRHFSCRSVLIHASDVTPEVNESDYFVSIINIVDFLNV